DTGTALITRLGDRGRDRHAREDEFQAYDHYLKLYWEDRSAAVEIVDTVGRGGSTITFNVTTEFKLHDDQAELRFFYRGIGTVAEYHNNGVMTPLDDLHYTRTVSVNGATGQPLQVGDSMEFELSQFLDPTVEAKGGRANYYGTTYLYVVGRGLVPWQAHQAASNVCPCPGEASFPIPEEGWLGGKTTLPYQYSNEPDNHFLQMSTNLSSVNAQPFLLGRRAVHTDFLDGKHDEDPANPVWTEQAGKLGPLYVNHACDACHTRNTRALAPEAGSLLDQYIVKVADADADVHALFGALLQPGEDLGASEGTVTLARWVEADGLRRPEYSFTPSAPARFSARAAPQLVGMGLLEAIPESAILAHVDAEDADGDGISGRARVVVDPESGALRLGRLGWKAGQAKLKHQIAAALNTDMGVMTSVFPKPDCGPAQTNCGASGAELADADLDHLVKYFGLLGIRARRGLDDAAALRGEELFESIGCADCHTTTFTTSAHHPFGELRGQTIHPYTDLLLHDMGEGLADTLGEGSPHGEGDGEPDGAASGSEWRTAPLWSIGLTRPTTGSESYLHDGRARTLEEAIRWHGGEGAKARDGYLQLSAQEKDALLAFLRSL
ncbi:MAG TPA: di-heme oxidoredictase family protein, partial [Polyangiaceae bacterium]|nr:di-heme oxidoredictase family protein [Polyangiaceae bacterium]